MKFDFSGYATKNDLKCSDGRTIKKDAFKESNGIKVPLVWQHVHNDPNNVLGHAYLENRADGVYTFGKFNDTDAGKTAKALVMHGDIVALSIYANQLIQKGTDVIHGAIREVSLVLTGANPGAIIDNLVIQHSDGTEVDDATEAVICVGVDNAKMSLTEIEHSDAAPEADPAKVIAHAAAGKSMADVFNTLNEEQKTVVYALIAQATGEEADDAAQADQDPNKIIHSEGDKVMKKNIFDKQDQAEGKDSPTTLTHAQFAEIVADAAKTGSFKASFLAHIDTYGITNIGYLFPDAKAVSNTPEFIKRETEWVGSVVPAAYHSPFSRIKTMAADLTADTARALGYVKGTLKKEEIISLLKRITTPTTIYKKQKLDRDDIIDITDLDVVAWLKSEMRMMLDEELARAVLVSDGRDPASDDKILEANIRPIWKDDDLYAHHVAIPAITTTDGMIDAIIRAMKDYKGSGNPVYFTTADKLADMLLLKDKNDRRIYMSVAELATTLGVSKIVKVPVMENLSRVVGQDTLNLVGIIVNMKDYTIGADKGGAIGMFDDFDIDYNQYKYLIETRCSGALTKVKSALVIEKIA